MPSAASFVLWNVCLSVGYGFSIKSRALSQSNPEPSITRCSTKLNMFSNKMSSRLWYSDSQASYFSFGGGIGDEDIIEEDHCFEEDYQLFSYLPDKGLSLPPRTKSLLKQTTMNYVNREKQPTNNHISFRDISKIIEKEYETRDVPVYVSDVSVDVTQTGQEIDETLAEILSLCAIHQVPQEITSELLQLGFQNLPKTSDNKFEAVKKCIIAFNETGWSSVSLPQGLAVVKPKPHLLPLLQDPPFSIYSSSNPATAWLPWNKRRRVRDAQAAVEAAKAVKPPQRRKMSRQEFLAKMEAQLSSTEIGSTIIPPTNTNSLNGGGKFRNRGQPLLFFPDNSASLAGISVRRVKRFMSRKYATLKLHGRSGFLAYCFFNFMYYLVGMCWQWSRVAMTDPLTTTASLRTLCLVKFGKVFATLCAISQIFKLPKLVTAVAVAPVAGKCLQITKEKFKVSETVATIFLVGFLMITWMAIVSVPILSDYARLLRIVRMDEQLLQMYGVQPI